MIDSNLDNEAPVVHSLENERAFIVSVDRVYIDLTSGFLSPDKRVRMVF